jgi:hypothetical protein
MEDSRRKGTKDLSELVAVTDCSDGKSHYNNICNIGVKYNFEGIGEEMASKIIAKVEELARQHGRISVVRLRDNSLADVYHGFFTKEDAQRFWKSLTGPGVSQLNYQAEVLETSAPILYVTYPTTIRFPGIGAA